jgi:hypothetical protein
MLVMSSGMTAVIIRLHVVAYIRSSQMLAAIDYAKVCECRA